MTPWKNVDLGVLLRGLIYGKVTEIEQINTC